MLDLERSELIFFIAIYVVFQIALGLWFARGTKSDTEYYIAGGRLGFFPITLSLFATWFGAETILGSSAAVAEGGLSGARAEPFGYAICLVAMAFLVAGPIRSHGYVTISDFFRDRFGKHAEFITAIVLVIISVIWAGAQLLAIAAILETTVGLPGVLTLFVAAGVVIFYSMFAGLIGDVVTDVVQGLFLMAGVVVLFVVVAHQFGGLSIMIGSIEPEQLRLVGPGESVFSRADAWAIPVIGSLVTQEVITRFLAARSSTIAKGAAFSAAGLYMVIGLMPVLIGLSGAHLDVPGAVGDNFLPAIAVQYLPPVLAIVFVGALFSAILSTVDSNLLAVSSLICINILKKLHQRSSERGQLMIARFGTAFAGVGALAVALGGSDIYELIALTSVFGQGAIVVATLVGLRTRFGGPAAALACVYSCVAFNLATLLILPLKDALAEGMAMGPALSAVLAGDVEPIAGYFIYSVIVSFIVYFVVGALESLGGAAKRKSA
ncbi:sodium:solute symporter family transporter [Hyphococcus luteus]|uniref:Sodium:solute symporter n=1 Tax=Hyphococcus luteus TaxID=2058213 RepID=A0A2S7K3N1_9PROT|nr:sodium:solute symporter [Marinicaulis flavus]PQA87048.1 sodium:solute symporter [Marinicaulis flavus]